MKKSWLFTFSIFIAMAIAHYSKSPHADVYAQKPGWKTFFKKSDREISAHKATSIELAEALIPEIKRGIAQVSEAEIQNSPSHNTMYLYREGRVLIGDIQKNDYQNEEIALPMINRPNTKWKDILGNDLIRFQDEDTKVMIKEELSVIKIEHGKGRYLEQVIITYVSKNGNLNSYRAMVDSESGIVLDTWDKTVHEKKKQERAGLDLPSENESGIVAR